MMLLSLCLGVLLPKSDLDTSLYVQKSAVDITPDESLPLGGYTERGARTSQPGGDHLFARCVLLHTGELKVAIVSAEMLTVPESLYTAVQSKLAPGTKLFLCATHTHCAPDSQMLNSRMTFAIPGIATFKRRWLSWYAEKISSAVSKAEQAQAVPVREMDAAAVQIDLNRGRRAGAKPDKTATYVQANGSLPLIFSYAAHPVFYSAAELHFRADWPGAVAQELGCPVLQGAIGDVSPNLDGTSPSDRISRFTSAIASAVKTAPMKSVWKPQKPLSWIEVPITLGKTLPHPDFIKNNHLPQVLAQTLVDKFAPTSAQAYALRLGSLAIVGIPGEPTSHLGRKIRDYGRTRGFADVLVVSHVNGWIGYILDAIDYSHGGYEATLSFYGPDNGDSVVKAGKAALDGLMSQH